MKGSRLRKGTWVVACDGRKWIILENRGDDLYPNLQVRETREQTVPLTHELGSDAPPRVFASAGGSRSAIEQTDWHEEAERRFLIALAGHLTAALQTGEARELIVAAPPKSLGILRGAYSPQLKRAIQIEIDKDLVRLPTIEIEQAITAVAKKSGH